MNQFNSLVMRFCHFYNLIESQMASVEKSRCVYDNLVWTPFIILLTKLCYIIYHTSTLEV